jgi:hypothetical protein
MIGAVTHSPILACLRAQNIRIILSSQVLPYLDEVLLEISAYDYNFLIIQRTIDIQR